MRTTSGTGEARAANEIALCAAPQTERYQADPLHCTCEGIINAIPTPVAVLRDDFSAIFVNQAFCHYFRTTAEETIGHDLSAHSPGILNSPTLRNFLNHIRGKSCVEEDCEIELADWAAEQRRIVICAREAGRYYAERQIVLFFQDMTEQGRAERIVDVLAAEPQWTAEFGNIRRSVQLLQATARTLRQLQGAEACQSDGAAGLRLDGATGDLADQLLRTAGVLRDILTSYERVAKPPAAIDTPGRATTPTPFPTRPAMPQLALVIAADPAIGELVAELLEGIAWHAEIRSTVDELLAWPPSDENVGLIIDGNLLDATGIKSLNRLRDGGLRNRIILLVDHIDSALKATQFAGIELVRKPIDPRGLLATVQRCWQQQPMPLADQLASTAKTRFARLTRQEHRVADLVLGGNPNKRIAAILGISRRTVEHHRQAVMRKVGAKSLCELVRLAVACEAGDSDQT